MNPDTGNLYVYNCGKWKNTGDLATIIDGGLKIIDKQEIVFKLRDGTIIFLTGLEKIFKESKYIDDIRI